MKARGAAGKANARLGHVAMRRLLSWVPGLALALVVLGSVGGWLWFRAAVSPVESVSREVVVSVPAGTSPVRIGRLLKKAGVIRSPQAFLILVGLKNAHGRLLAGEHRLDPSFSASQILEALVKGRFLLRRLTVPEGLTLEQVAARVAQAGLADEEAMRRLFNDAAFIRELGLAADNLEGYLFPETYYFAAGTSPREIARAMVRRFLAVWKGLEDKAGRQGMDQNTVVTLASMVERETGQPSERPLIAAVFLHRLKLGMRLESDPTVIYGLPAYDGNLTRKDLETYSPYNTYRIAGLPPGPIASPGLESLKAVLYPAKVNYLFFVSKNDGSHQFSRTKAEHLRAVKRYQTSLKQGQGRGEG